MSEPTEVDKVYVAVMSVRGTTVSFFSVDPVAMDFMAVCKLLLGDVCAVDDDGVGVTEADAVGPDTDMFGTTEDVFSCVEVGVVSRDEKVAGVDGSADVPGVWPAIGALELEADVADME